MLYLERKRFQDAFHLLWIANVSLQRHFFADRLALAHRLHRPIILAAGIAIELTSVLTEQAAQSFLTYMLQVSTSLNAQLSEFGRCYLAYSQEFLDGQRVKESSCLVLGNDGQSIGLVRI